MIESLKNHLIYIPNSICTYLGQYFQIRAQTLYLVIFCKFLINVDWLNNETHEIRVNIKVMFPLNDIDNELIEFVFLYKVIQRDGRWYIMFSIAYLCYTYKSTELKK